jgi:oligopeptide transport system permease protein
MASGLATFACKKLLSCMTSLFVIITLTFFLMKIIPGDPLTQEQFLPRDVYENLRAYYGFDQPLLKQYASYIKSILTLDMGPSLIHSGRTVSGVIRETFPVSGFLGVEALAIAIFFGIGAGVFSALSDNKLFQWTMTTGALLFLSIPSFILGSFLQYVLSVKLAWLPVARWDTMAHTVLPAIALAAMPGAFLAKIIRTNMLDVLKQDYIFLARAKGLSWPRIVRSHAFRNALLPLFGYLGKMSANILVGSFVIEKIFNIPGLGYWFVSSIGNRDYPMIMGLTIFYSVVLLSTLFFADMAHAWLDSRIYRRQET